MRQYTVAEARALLPQVIPVVQQLRNAYLELRALQAAIEIHARGASGDGNLTVDPWDGGDGENRVESLNRELRSAAVRLSRWGIELKDPERGLIDFYHERPNGEIVFLCYEIGEDNITHWHHLSDGYAGRKPLEE
ncbi:MAG: DUF2203 domain-containing protein [Dehalococcoidia bacterium]|nr:DUF2203 domain-containing protein [Dehalococcoidia bacterium]